MSEFILEEMFASAKNEGAEGVRAFAKYLTRYPLVNDNLPMYLKVFNTNDDEAISHLLRNRAPLPFFGSITPNAQVLHTILATMSNNKVNILNPKVLLAYLGILQNAYFSAMDGMKTMPISVQQLYHIGKYYRIEDSLVQTTIQDFFSRLMNVHGQAYSDVSRIARDILDATYDHQKKLHKVIPENILAF